VIAWDDVSLDEGTGIVHIAPGCGGEDFELLLTCERASVDALRDGLLRATGTALTVVGEIESRGTGVTFLDAAGMAVARIRAGRDVFCRAIAGRSRDSCQKAKQIRLERLLPRWRTPRGCLRKNRRSPSCLFQT
jgi:isoleucyl-tRNA synthetase